MKIPSTRKGIAASVAAVLKSASRSKCLWFHRIGLPKFQLPVEVRYCVAESPHGKAAAIEFMGRTLLLIEKGGTMVEPETYEEAAQAFETIMWNKIHPKLRTVKAVILPPKMAELAACLPAGTAVVLRNGCLSAQRRSC